MNNYITFFVVIFSVSSAGSLHGNACKLSFFIPEGFSFDKYTEYNSNFKETNGFGLEFTYQNTLNNRAILQLKNKFGDNILFKTKFNLNERSCGEWTEYGAFEGYFFELSSQDNLAKANSILDSLIEDYAGEPTQTQAYLLVPELRNVIAERYASDIINHEKIIRKMLAQEAAFNDTHFVFYHARKQSLRLFTDVLTEIYGALENRETRKSFFWLREKPSNTLPLSSVINRNLVLQSVQSCNMQEFHFIKWKFPRWSNPNDSLFSNLKEISRIVMTMEASTMFSMILGSVSCLLLHGRDEWDSKAADLLPSVSDRLLSTNLSLFGSSVNFGAISSSSFDYFLRSLSQRNFEPRNLLKPVLENLGFDLVYLEQFEKAFNEIYTNTGNMVQIFIPKNLVENHIFLSWHGGIPASDYMLRRTHTSWKPHFLLNRQFLEDFKRGQITPFGLDVLQARIYIDELFLLNHDGEAKIFSYDAVPEERLRHYKQRIKEIVRDMVNQSKGNE